MTNVVRCLGVAEKAISVRLDAEAQDALAFLTSGGATQSEAIRQALIDASRAGWYRQAELDAKRLAADPADRAEVAAIQEFFGELDPAR